MWILQDMCVEVCSRVIYLIMILNIRNSNSWCVYPDLSVLTSLAFFFFLQKKDSAPQIQLSAVVPGGPGYWQADSI